MEFAEQIKKVDEMLDDSSLSHSEIHPETVYVSRQLDPLNIKNNNRDEKRILKT
ncbi:20069_t:CDS:2 [Dentiscutata erythropus]|uniref:20069_t:CDS:1 n=1 Tax=Dentiscutata erythropus TaxID=1348616 RepID=A0A9N8Z0V5_9GLOM|nr:20069_t:CDS:2 [Dentiscutata erythropus]